MLEKLKQRWRSLLDDEPGHRFQNRYARRHKQRSSPGIARAAWSVAAVLLILVGVVALPLPGPGLLVIAGGLALLAQESLTIARFLDHVELWVRRILGKPGPRRKAAASRRS